MNIIFAYAMQDFRKMADVPGMFEDKTRHGIEKLQVMLFLIPVLEAKSGKKCTNALNRLKSFLVQNLQRGITPQENLDLLKGCHAYIITDAETPERIAAMDYLFDLKFLQDEKIKNAN